VIRFERFIKWIKSDIWNILIWLSIALPIVLALAGCGVGYEQVDKADDYYTEARP
jgi:hypothetical protein